MTVDLILPIEIIVGVVNFLELKKLSKGKITRTRVSMSAEPEPESTMSTGVESRRSAEAPTRDNDRDTTSHIGPEDDVLRNAPTFVEDEKNDTTNKPTTARGGGEEGTTTTATPKPGIVEKIMTKLGLNPIMLMSMFKSVVPTSNITLSSMRADMDPSFLCVTV